MSIRTLFFRSKDAKMPRGRNILSLFVFSCLFVFGFFAGSPEVKAQWYGMGWCDPVIGCTGILNTAPGSYGNCNGAHVACPMSGLGCTPLSGVSGGDCCTSSGGISSFVCEVSGGGGPIPTSPACAYPPAGSSFANAPWNMGLGTAWMCASGSSESFSETVTEWTWVCREPSLGSVTCSSGKIPPSPPAPELAFTADRYSLLANESTTIRWFSRNAESCTASRSPVGGTWTGPKGFTHNQPYSEPTEALPGGQVYTYRLTCTGAPGTSPATLAFDISVAAPPLPPFGPMVIFPTCDSAAGDHISLRYAVPGASWYYLRIDDPSTPPNPSWSGTCAIVNPGDTCLDGIGEPYSRSIVPGRTYTAWGHAWRAADGKWADSAGVSFRCDAPAPLPTATLSLNPNPVNIHSTAGTPTVRATWSSTDATSCVATSGNGFVTGGATSSPVVGVIIPTPGAVDKYTYSVRCDGPGGSAVGSDVLDVVSYCNPTTTCTASDICKGESCDNGCDVITGTKDCRKFWKEVAP